MNKNILYLAVFLFIFSVGAISLVLVSQNNQNSSQIESDSNNSSINQAPSDNPNSNTADPSKNLSSGERVFSMAEVEDADNIDRKCLVVYKNNVYEIPSSWKNQHPGGSSYIISSCGRDITTDFENSHSGSTATRKLESFKVGILE